MKNEGDIDSVIRGTEIPGMTLNAMGLPSQGTLYISDMVDFEKHPVSLSPLDRCRLQRSGKLSGAS